jgi:hypothetical protein
MSKMQEQRERNHAAFDFLRQQGELPPDSLQFDPSVTQKALAKVKKEAHNTFLSQRKRGFTESDDGSVYTQIEVKQPSRLARLFGARPSLTRSLTEIDEHQKVVAQQPIDNLKNILRTQLDAVYEKALAGEESGENRLKLLVQRDQAREKLKAAKDNEILDTADLRGVELWADTDKGYRRIF